MLPKLKTALKLHFKSIASGRKPAPGAPFQRPKLEVISGGKDEAAPAPEPPCEESAEEPEGTPSLAQTLVGFVSSLRGNRVAQPRGSVKAAYQKASKTKKTSCKTGAMLDETIE